MHHQTSISIIYTHIFIFIRINTSIHLSFIYSSFLKVLIIFRTFWLSFWFMFLKGFCSFLIVDFSVSSSILKIKRFHNIIKKCHPRCNIYVNFSRASFLCMWSNDKLYCCAANQPLSLGLSLHMTTSPVLSMSAWLPSSCVR